jgi:pseudouridine synthase
VETLQGYCGDAILSLDELGIHSKLHAIGRLDVDTTGLLLLTNDGRLVHHVTNPTTTSGKSIPKTYEAIIMGFWNDTSPELEEMRLHGVAIGAKYGGQTRPPVSLHVLDHPTSKSTRVEITINEGKNRQVRRMFHAIGSGVMKLARTGIGGDDGSRLTLGDLRQGQWRVLTNDEVERHLDWKPRVLTTTESVTGTGKSGHPGRRQGASKRRHQESRQARRRR